jgi:signal transduction histidine kinase
MTKRVVAQLSNTVANFLNAARLESGRFTPNFRRTLIRDLVHETVAALRPLIDQKGTRLILDFPAQPLPVRADPDALSLVMTNLIGNAFKYTPKNGAVTVKIAASNDAASKVLVSVEDTGIGISDEDQKRLFAGFFRTAPGQETAKGYGVGLKVAHDLLESQGARLELESVPGKGSRFFFHLAPWMGKTVPAPSGRSS